MTTLLQIQMSPIDYFSLISSITSIILGIVAIVLSVLFYRMSEKTGRENEKVATSIASNVTKLEELFNKLYSGTFDMMKETVTDMRKHAYSSGKTILPSEVEDKVIKETISSLTDEINALKTRKLEEKDIAKLVEDVLNKSKKIESSMQNEKIREEILSFLKIKGKTTYGAIDKCIRDKGLLKGGGNSIFQEIKKLADEGVTNYPFMSEPDGSLSVNFSENVYLL